MFLTAPLWLTLLVPWAGLLAWALVGRRPAVDVPFVQLWRGPAAAAVPPRRRGRRRPPAPVVLVLLAVLLAVLAAAGPRWDAGGGRITLIVDRGASASGRVGGDVRYRAAMRDLATALPRGTTVHVSTVPAGVQSTGDAGGLAMLAPAIAPTAVDTRAAIFAAATSVTAPAIAITDAPLPDRHGLFRIPPPPPGEDVAITSFAARAAPRPQVMVRVRNDSAATTARLTVRSGTVTTAVDVPLPPRGQSKRYFIDLPALAETVEAALADGDATEANDAAYLAAGTAWARPEPRGPLPSMVADVLAAYARARSPTARSTTVAIITDAGQLSPTAPAVLLPEPTGPPLPATVDPTVADDPLVRDVDWAAALSGATLATPPDQQAFVPLVRVGPRPAVAVTRADPRRVW
ncbi:MAG TPA: hypothetical protein VK324_06000, partial [Tepidisphaeraceae bacterium]|nr:hypothetical protein [Tepidisphaeraceae bacterium]